MTPPDETRPESDTPNEGESHIHVDESWKERARREKERLASAAQEGDPSAETSGGEESAGESAGEAAPGADASPGGAGAEMGPLPPANFLMFVSSLATQAMVHLGAIPDPVTGQTAEDLDHAKYMIDLLEMLQEKTKGNLDDREAQTLKSILYDLRMTYVQKTR
jgi:hypothetical protein